MLVDRPRLIALHPDRVAGAAGAGVRSREGPVVLDTIPVHDEVVEVDVHVGQGLVEARGDRGDGVAAHRRRTPVDREGALRRVVLSHYSRVHAAPGRGVALGEGAQLLGIRRHYMPPLAVSGSPSAQAGRPVPTRHTVLRSDPTAYGDHGLSPVARQAVVHCLHGREGTPADETPGPAGRNGGSLLDPIGRGSTRRSTEREAVRGDQRGYSATSTM